MSMSGEWRMYDVTGHLRKTRRLQPFQRHPSPVTRRAFTLIEMLVVITILGILAALAVPAIKNIGKADAAMSASRQMLDAVGHARQLAIANHTTVYMVFVPTNFWAPPVTSSVTWTNCLPADRLSFGRQSVRQAIDAATPSSPMARWATSRDSMPGIISSRGSRCRTGSFIAQWKFGPRGQANPIVNHVTGATYPVQGFDTAPIPFPSEDYATLAPSQPLPEVPCIAFNYLGQLVSGQDEYIPLAQGTVMPARTVNKNLQLGSPDVTETPPGNSVNVFNLVQIDWLTGRAVLRNQKVQ